MRLEPGEAMAVGIRGALMAFAVLTGVMAVLIAAADDALGSVTGWGVLVSVPMLGTALAVAALALAHRTVRD